MKFTKYAGMILCEDPETTKAALIELERRGEKLSRWRYERGANHEHTLMGVPDRLHVEQELELAASLKTNLRAAYPDHRFVISHIPCYAVSFYQPEDDAPTSGTLPARNEQKGREEALCMTCHQRTKMQRLPLSESDPPMTEWSRCAVCGEDTLLYREEILTQIG